MRFVVCHSSLWLPLFLFAHHVLFLVLFVCVCLTRLVFYTLLSRISMGGRGVALYLASFLAYFEALFHLFPREVPRSMLLKCKAQGSQRLRSY
ncbi:hypothetical protein K457DRAFT_654963 [Linnemannia elongata AG-77]|uniref:Uncharacterized protein n=1 Tax=Linnemannia elongata AG-77 TaxID=1314771 RepID=A0A197KC24_9FUNG|nr:hypothetical protein K457DRAFT_654963 [Linnemannia elongata AG-77]